MSMPRILTPTLLEYLAAKSVLPWADITWTGVGLARWRATAADAGYLLCGLAGGLAADPRPGTVLIPERVGLADGRRFDCDPAMVRALQTAARDAALTMDSGPLLTADEMIVGPARRIWAGKGFVAADMETGKLAASGFRVATVRVILDSAKDEISPEWEHPLQAVLHLKLKELFWLGWAAPLFSRRAARALKAGLSLMPAEGW